MARPLSSSLMFGFVLVGVGLGEASVWGLGLGQVRLVGRFQARGWLLIWAAAFASQDGAAAS